MKLSYIFSDLLNEDFKSQTQKFISQNYEPEIVKSYIEKFKYIRDNKYREALNPDLNIDVPVEKRFDIDAYKTFQALEIFVDYVSGQRPVKTTMSKQNDVEFTGEAIYNKNGIEVFYADNPRACIKYKGSIPYSWCVARADSSNMFYTYRFKPSEPAFYFVKDVKATEKELVNLAKRGVINGTFENKYHFIVIQVPKNLDPNDNKTPQYIVTSAINDGDIQMSWDQIIEINPKLVDIKDVLKPKPFTPEERAQHERFKNGISDNEFKKLSYEEKKTYLEIYPTIAKPITTKQFLDLPDDLKNLYVSYGIGLDDEQFDSIKNNPKLVKRYAQISDRKLDVYLKSSGWQRRNLRMMYSELIVLKDDRITQYLDTLDKDDIGSFIAINGIDKLDMLQKHSSNKFVSNYFELKPIIYGLSKGDEEAIETLDEKLPDGVSVSYSNYARSINFDLSNVVNLDIYLVSHLESLSDRSWEPWRDNYFYDLDDANAEYEGYIKDALNDPEFVTKLTKNGIKPTLEVIIELLESFDLEKPIKEYINELYTEAKYESELKTFNKLSDKFNDVITYDSTYNRYSHTTYSNITIKISNFVGAVVVDSDILTKDNSTFESAFESLLYRIMGQAKLPTNDDEMREFISNDWEAFNVPNDEIIEKIKDSVYEIIDDNIDDEEFIDKKNSYNVLLAFKEVLKGLGEDVNTNEIENDLVRIYFDKDKIKGDGSIFANIRYKKSDKTYSGYMFIKDIAAYFQNYKLFEAIENFKKLIK